jgi:hypothetical protein
METLSRKKGLGNLGWSGASRMTSHVGMIVGSSEDKLEVELKFVFPIISLVSF